MLGLWLMVQLVVLLALLLGGLYALFCLSRAASGLDRLAGAVEEWVERENAKSAPPLPGAMRPMPVPPVPATPPVPPSAPPSFIEEAFGATREENS